MVSPPFRVYNKGTPSLSLVIYLLFWSQNLPPPIQAFNVPKLQTPKCTLTPKPLRASSGESSSFFSSSSFPNSSNNKNFNDAKNETAELLSIENTPARTTSSEEASVPLNQTMRSPPAETETSKGISIIDKQKILKAAGIPSYKTLLILISTTILIWLSEPLLSLVDTTTVGRFAEDTVLQLASLGPATMLMDNAIYSTYFLSIATTNQIAKGLASKDYSKLQSFSSQVLGLAAILGGIITLSIFTLGQPLLKISAGASASPALIRWALQYCQIRGIVAPLAIVNMVAQSLCLATLDTRTPAFAVLAASVMNIIGDFALVPSLGMAGAAAATAAATATSSAILLRRVSSIRSEWMSLSTSCGNAQRISQVIDGVPTIVPRTNNKNSTMTHNNDRRSRNQKSSPLFSIPSSSSLLEMLLLGGPIFGCIVGKIICYSGMTVRVAKFGVTSMAAHNILLRLFFFMTVFGEAVGNATQTFLPGVWLNQKRQQRRNKDTEESTSLRPVRHLLRRVGIVGFCVGLFSKVAMGQLIARFGSFGGVTPSITSLLETAQSWSGWASFIYPAVMIMEQSLVATRDLTYLLKSYLLTMVLHFGCLRWITNSFGDVWRTVFLFQVIRVVQFAIRTSRKIIFDDDNNNIEESNQVVDSVTTS